MRNQGFLLAEMDGTERIHRKLAKTDVQMERYIKEQRKIDADIDKHFRQYRKIDFAIAEFNQREQEQLLEIQELFALKRAQLKAMCGFA